MEDCNDHLLANCIETSYVRECEKPTRKARSGQNRRKGLKNARWPADHWALYVVVALRILLRFNISFEKSRPYVGFDRNVAREICQYVSK